MAKFGHYFLSGLGFIGFCLAGVFFGVVMEQSDVRAVRSAGTVLFWIAGMLASLSAWHLFIRTRAMFRGLRMEREDPEGFAQLQREYREAMRNAGSQSDASQQHSRQANKEQVSFLELAQQVTGEMVEPPDHLLKRAGPEIERPARVEWFALQLAADLAAAVFAIPDARTQDTFCHALCQTVLLRLGASPESDPDAVAHLESSLQRYAAAKAAAKVNPDDFGNYVSEAFFEGLGMRAEPVVMFEVQTTYMHRLSAHRNGFLEIFRSR